MLLWHEHYFFPPNYISRIFPSALSIDVNLVSCDPSWLTIRRRFASVIPGAAPLSLPLWDAAGDSNMQMFEAAFKHLIGLLLYAHKHFYWYIVFIFTESINSNPKTSWQEHFYHLHHLLTTLSNAPRRKCPFLVDMPSVAQLSPLLYFELHNAPHIFNGRRIWTAGWSVWYLILFTMKPLLCSTCGMCPDIDVWMAADVAPIPECTFQHWCCLHRWSTSPFHGH